MWVVENGEHNNTFMLAGPAYTMRLGRFMAKCLGEEAAPQVEDNSSVVAEHSGNEVEDANEAEKQPKKTKEKSAQVLPTQEDESVIA